MRGVSRILKCLPSDKLEMFHVSLAIRIRPFLENQNLEIREAAIVLFGDLCSQEEAEHMNKTVEASETLTYGVERISEALREQLYANLCSIILHLGEQELQIVHVSL
jgi:maestro heat-like repeat-containing protein family member 1